MLGHELRNPPAPIRNAAQILEMIDAPGEHFPAVRDMIERQVHQLARLVDVLLDVSRIMRGTVELRPEPLDLAAVVDRTIETALPLIDAQGHALTVSMATGGILMRGDRARAGFDGHLVKPVDPAAIEELLSSLASRA